MGGVVPLFFLELHMLPFCVGIIWEGDDHGEINGLFLPDGFFWYWNTRCQNIYNGQAKIGRTIPCIMGCPGGACLS